MMTILEAMEWLVVAAAAGLCFVGCCASRRSPSADGKWQMVDGRW